MAVGIETILSSLASEVKKIAPSISIICIFIGVVLSVSVLSALHHKQKYHLPIEPGKSTVGLFLCFCLVNIRTITNITSHSLGMGDVNYAQDIAYIPMGADFGDFNPYITNLFTIISFLGFLAAVKGVMKLKKASSRDVDGLVGGGFVHLIAGVLLMNINTSIELTLKTLGLL